MSYNATISHFGVYPMEILIHVQGRQELQKYSLQNG